MAKASKVKQLFFSLPNNVGLLMEITEALAKAKINVEAICAYAWEELNASFMLVTDNNTKAKNVLSRMGAKVELEDVLALEVPNKVGELHKATKKIAFAGIDIYYLYGSPAKGKMTLIVKTENDKKALKALAK
ncbi:MAG: hypothetical protein EG828_13775 [Deltaproteobacteria bacterium]|nr:hypothetical protein [Deltaproteobacteria bacterium]